MITYGVYKYSKLCWMYVCMYERERERERERESLPVGAASR